MPYVSFAGFFGYDIPKVADFGLADAVNSAETLFEPVWVPRQIVVHHQVSALEIDTFASRICGDQYAHSDIRAKQGLSLTSLIAVSRRRES